MIKEMSDTIRTVELQIARKLQIDSESESSAKVLDWKLEMNIDGGRLDV